LNGFEPDVTSSLIKFKISFKARLCVISAFIFALEMTKEIGTFGKI
jgi:hypothetical protein